MRYDLDRLGWLEFENLLKALLKVRYGDGVEVCGSIHDGGREAFFNGPLKYPSQHRTSQGPFFFQCKFIENASAPGGGGAKEFLKHITHEASMIRKRISGKARFKWTVLPRHYVLFTNASLDAVAREKTRAAIQAEIPKCKVHIHPGPDICAWVDASPSVVVRFPQLFSIADFKELLKKELKSDIRNRSETAIKLAERIAAAFVPTEPYREALVKLGRHHFVILEGPPEMGKTSIARMLALVHFKDGWEAIECRDPKDILREYEAEKKQLFVADDCFGQTDYRADRVGAWQDELHYILPRLDKNHLLILTSRAHLWQMARRHLAASGRGVDFPDLGEIVVNASRLPNLDKARILYRHAKLASLPKSYCDGIRGTALDVVKNPHFTPERVRLLIHAIRQKANS